MNVVASACLKYGKMFCVQPSSLKLTSPSFRVNRTLVLPSEALGYFLTSNFDDCRSQAKEYFLMAAVTVKRLYFLKGRTGAYDARGLVNEEHQKLLVGTRQKIGVTCVV
jgi:hypothetical protein